MPKRRTSKEHEFSFKNMQVLKLKDGARVLDHSPSEQLKNRKLVADALLQSLQDGDAEAFKDILRAHLDIINKTEFARKIKISERTLYRMVSEEGNPTLDNIAKVVQALCA
jgi:probable addiction module antidote protein